MRRYTCNHILTPPMSVSISRKARARRIGNSVGLTLPKDIREQFGIVDKSDLTISVTPDGILIRPHQDAKFAEAMEAFDRVSARYKNALKELAK